MKAMEVQLIASFPDSNQMLRAMHELRSQGALDIRVLSGSPGEAGTYPSAGAGEHPRYALSIWMERSRYRLAEDTILRRQGTFLPGSTPLLVFAQDLH